MGVQPNERPVRNDAYAVEPVSDTPDEATAFRALQRIRSSPCVSGGFQDIRDVLELGKSVPSLDPKTLAAVLRDGRALLESERDRAGGAKDLVEKVIQLFDSETRRPWATKIIEALNEFSQDELSKPLGAFLGQLCLNTAAAEPRQWPVNYPDIAGVNAGRLLGFCLPIAHALARAGRALEEEVVTGDLLKASLLEGPTDPLKRVAAAAAEIKRLIDDAIAEGGTNESRLSIAPPGHFGPFSLVAAVRPEDRRAADILLAIERYTTLVQLTWELAATLHAQQTGENGSKNPEESRAGDVLRMIDWVVNGGGLSQARLPESTLEIRDAPETQRWMEEARWVQGVSVEDFCHRVDYRPEARELLGKNFLGAEEWKAQGIDVGEPPPIPSSITKALLDSACPLHPGKLIKETHILVLVPETVNGKAYTALKLDELCARRKGSGDSLLHSRYESWKSQPWATLPQSQSEWVLLPKSDPDPEVSPDQHFRSKHITAQQKMHSDHYKEYREVKTLEVMTMALLYDLTHKERLLPDYLRCEEPNASGGRVCVGRFSAFGLNVFVVFRAFGYGSIGRALARKLKT